MTRVDAGRVIRFAETELQPVVAHGGSGELQTARVLEREPGEFVTFLDLTIVPPGVSVGLHRHSPDDEEVYVVIDGTGMVEVDGVQQEVGPGDVVLNAPGGSHSLTCTGAQPLRMVVVDVARAASSPAVG